MDATGMLEAVRMLRETAAWIEVRIQEAEAEAAELYRATGGNATAVAPIVDRIAQMRATQDEYRAVAHRVEGAYLRLPGSTQGEA